MRGLVEAFAPLSSAVPVVAEVQPGLSSGGFERVACKPLYGNTLCGIIRFAKKKITKSGLEI